MVLLLSLKDRNLVDVEEKGHYHRRPEQDVCGNATTITLLD